VERIAKATFIASSAGLAGSVLMHGLTLLGWMPPSVLKYAFHVGAGIAALAALALAQRPSVPPPWTRWELWKAMYAGAPSWMPNTVLALVAYDFLQFALVVADFDQARDRGIMSSVPTMRVFTTNWILLNFMACTLAYVALKRASQSAAGVR